MPNPEIPLTLPDALYDAVTELAKYQGITPVEFLRRAAAREVERQRPTTSFQRADLWDVESTITRMANAFLVQAMDGDWAELHFVTTPEGYQVTAFATGRSEEMQMLPLHIVPLLRDHYLEMALMNPEKVIAPVEGRFSVQSRGREFAVLLRFMTDPLGETLTLQLTSTP